MDQSIHENHKSLRLLGEGKKIAFIQAGWHKQIVSQAFKAFTEECLKSDIMESQVELFDVPGSLEIPLQAKLLAKSGNYSVIVAAGLVVDGGIYRHDFVASSVSDAMMKIQIESEVPILSVVLTPHNFQETDIHQSFFFEHFKTKGREAAEACVQTLKNRERLELVC